MKRYKLEEKIQEKGCFALVKLLKQSKVASAQEDQVKCGACFHLNILRRKGSDNRCEMCSKLLEGGQIDVISGKDKPSEEAKPTQHLLVQDLVDAGALGLIVDALRRFEKSEGIQKAGCYALAQICHDDEEAVERLAMEGGIGVLLCTMQTLCLQREVQAQCLGILASPVLLRDAIIRVEAQDFAATVVGTFQRFRGSARIQALAMLALANLGFKNQANIVMLTRAPFEELVADIFKGIRWHRGDSKVVTSGLWLVGCLAQLHDPEVHARMAENECTSLCMELLTEFPADAGIQRNVRLVLGYLGGELEGPKDKTNVHALTPQPSGRSAKPSLLPQSSQVDTEEELNECRLH